MQILRNIQARFNRFLDRLPRQKATWRDVVILSLFAIFITFQPYYRHGEVNFLETGLYLPGINEVLHGRMPYRDFFQLRGPFELYPPALLMQIFGIHINVLYTYFYVGNVLCLIFGILVARELFQTRLLLYLFTLPFIGRTWVRVVYMFWGGMRYAWGLLAAFCVVRYFKTKKNSWMLWAGVMTTIGSLTSVEIGAYVFLGVLAAFLWAFVFKLLDNKDIVKGFVWYLGGMAIVGLPYLILLYSQGALGIYVDYTLGTITDKGKTIDPHLVSTYPRNFLEAFKAMINPGSVNFKHMTPSYLYITLLVYLIWRLKTGKFQFFDLALVFMGIFGFIMYNTGFRGIWAAQFEMALMPEKILYFFLLEVFLLFCLAKRETILKSITGTSWKVIAINVFVIGLIASSIGYGIQRFNSRFFTFKYISKKIAGKDTNILKPFVKDKEPARKLTIERAKGILVPEKQADEIEAVVGFLQQNSLPTDKVLAYPELGNYNFFADRPFPGKFPLSTFAWTRPSWFENYWKDLTAGEAKYIVLQQKMPDDWTNVYMGYPPNKIKHNQILDYIYSQYEIVQTTPQSFILQRKSSN